MSSKRQAYFLAVITILLWSFGMYVSRLIAVSSEFILLGIAYCFSFVTLLIYFFIQKKGGLIPRIRRFKLKHALFGPFGYFVYSLTLIQSFRAFDTASETTILNYTWPIFTVIFTEILFGRGGKRAAGVRFIEGFGITLGLLAVALLATQGRLTSLSFNNPAGVAWGLAAGASYGVFSAYSSDVDEDQHSLFLLVSVTISIIVVGILSIREIHLLPLLTPKDFLAAAVLGCVMDALGYMAWTRANRLVRNKDSGTTIASIASMMYALPLLSLIIIALLLDERSLFQGYFVVCLGLVILSAVLCQRAEQIEGFFSSLRADT